MPPRRQIPPPPARIRAARLVDGNIVPLIGTYVEPWVRAKQELVELWDRLSVQGRAAVLNTARVTAHEESILSSNLSVISENGEVA